MIIGEVAAKFGFCEGVNEGEKPEWASKQQTNWAQSQQLELKEGIKFDFDS